MTHIRRAGPMDANNMADLLNEIIEIGGTTAMTSPVDGATLANRIDATPLSIWHIAEDDNGTLLGFQWVEPHAEHGETVGEIATFARVGQTGLGIGSRLFNQTCSVAKTLGYKWINAEIRSDNQGGLTYYQSRGFEDYGQKYGYRLADGTVVDKTLKRFDL